ncbi:nuclear transport factor 2 family protein [Luteolibacter pohnpeiensis]|uniref:nuclear transport factor 2 family protein n=1 Tax=Luteolibacter pohnpeiensis TaxID=454153 RepID=UPI001906CE59|nr:nuclear transport factor 2 family protein [Luteolibacter pohnpeiensis]
MDTWIHGINQGETEKVLELYSADAVLLPTFSSRTIANEEGRRRYFERLASRDELSVSLHEKTVRSQTVGSMDVISGIYCFRFAIDGEILSFEARFTFAMDLTQGSPIVHHHSSQVPRQLS